MKRLSSLRQKTLSRRAEGGVLLAVFALALGLRVAYLHVAGMLYAPPKYDGVEYDMLAAHLVNGQGFVLTEGQPYGFRPPGLPFFLALLYALLDVRISRFVSQMPCWAR